MSTPPAGADESPAPQSPDENPVTGEQPVTAAPAQAPAAPGLPVVVAQIPGHGPVYAQYPQAPPPVEPHPGPYPGQYPYYPGQPPHQGRPPHPGPHGHASSGFGAPPPPRPADRGGVVAVVGFVLVLVLGMLAVAVSADRGSERRARDEQPITFTLPPVQAITPPPIIATEPPTGRVQAQIGARMSPECDLADALLERAKTRNRAEGRSDSYFANCDYRTLADADTGYRELQVTVGAFDYPDIRNDWFDEEYGRRWDEVRELPGVGERAKVMLRPTDRSGDMVTIKVVSGVRIYEVVYGGTVRDSYLADPIPAAEAEAIAMEVLQAVMAR